ncbi:maleylpyruvate isomerase family mycothiol-dependent enzyme [Phycicoccus flavus]|uniref:Maleylpyruvate isomerase family protein n=1 Tax=Phycicoccus flavus TaxID=2502783 RepID=A0A8T6R5A5_9MICO|nr:maleylpyruvate isomerase family mycothiol-dependent enzyme [Phycicoccus flavus]NHA69608.1 maleylpyruvate isomerase family protein [Phycicoccus flavus]
MTSPADATIDALRATHDELAAVVRGLSDDELALGSGATDWTVAQVLSHLGSGAEISAATLAASVEGSSPPADGFNQSVWDRWNARSPREQADGFLAADAGLLDRIEALTEDQRRDLQVDLGFLPAPVPVSTYAAMRLNEAAQHSWDVRVALDPDAVIRDDTAALLVDQFAGGLAFLLGFSARADAVPEPALVDLPAVGRALSVTDTAALVAPGEEPTGTFHGSADAVARLMAGRLTAAHTPADVEVTGTPGLDALRQVFPGY